MTHRQHALIQYHRDVANFAVRPEAPVFVILDQRSLPGLPRERRCEGI